jgi:hypothetical protein
VLMLRFIYGAAGFGSVALFARVSYSGTVTIGSILFAIAVAALAGMYTIRAKVATVWKEEAIGYEAQAERLKDEITTLQADRASFDLEQQELRHGLKDNLAAVKAALEVEKAKHDLTSVITSLQEMHTEAMHEIYKTATEATGALQASQEALLAGQQAQMAVLTEIRDAVRENRPQEQ